jgi:hypothetical protein
MSISKRLLKPQIALGETLRWHSEEEILGEENTAAQRKKI